MLLVMPAALAGAKARADVTWRDVQTPAEGAPRSIGDYSAGCIQGAKALPLTGSGYQVVRPERRRYFGHPQLLGFLSKLGEGVRAAGLGRVLLGDLGQPRGGPAPGGHASHQTGLDVDIWYWAPDNALRPRALPSSALAQLQARSVLDGKTSSLAARWSARVSTLLRLTASDPRVARIFVHPAIKRSLCTATQGERGWLGKLRPWFGHDNHFHVRLACPQSSADCVAQAALQPGDGCDSVAWWFRPTAQKERDEERERYRSKVVRPLQLPAACDALLTGAQEAANPARAQLPSSSK
jgi:penicillin-insensitive murein DD-endopeptidase